MRLAPLPLLRLLVDPLVLAFLEIESPYERVTERDDRLVRRRMDRREYDEGIIA